MGRIIGLLGGVASGKSSVAALMAERGLILVDADTLAREIVDEDPTVKRALTARFGADIVDAQGCLDRALLAERAFAEPRSTADLNAIVHPPVRRRIEAALAAAGERPVVLDVPLLLESPLAEYVSDWVFIVSDPAARDARAAGRGWSAAERSRREGLQADLAAKRARADALLENLGTIEDLGRQVDALLFALGIPIRPRAPRDRP